MYQNFFNIGFEGFLASLTLIMVIGSQNAYVLKCSINNYFPFYVGLACFFGDLILMSLGVFGLAKILSEHAMALNIIRWFGVVFIVFYGCVALYNFFHIKTKLMGFTDEIYNLNRKQTSVWRAIIVALSFTFLNPHVYLDTIFIIGNLGIHYPPEKRIFFIIGCLTASAFWFLSLSCAGRVFSNILSSIRARKLIELSIACIMFFFGYKLMYSSI